MDFPLADLAREISGIMPNRLPSVSIKVDSLDKFCGALSEQVDLMAVKPEGLVSATFCGVDVVQNDLVPAGMAVITTDDEIIQIIRYS